MAKTPIGCIKHTQLQVILKPPPDDVQELYLESLEAIGIDLRQHDIKFEEDNWESPTLRRVGHRLAGDARWPGDHAVHLLPAVRRRGPGSDLRRRLTYGLERIAAFLQDVDSIYDIVWAREPDTDAILLTAMCGLRTSCSSRFTASSCRRRQSVGAPEALFEDGVPATLTRKCKEHGPKMDALER